MHTGTQGLALFPNQLNESIELMIQYKFSNLVSWFHFKVLFQLLNLEYFYIKMFILNINLNMSF